MDVVQIRTLAIPGRPWETLFELAFTFSSAQSTDTHLAVKIQCLAELARRERERKKLPDAEVGP